jgi:hypothetical protein
LIARILIEHPDHRVEREGYAPISHALPLCSDQPAAKIAALVEAAAFADPIIEPLLDQVLWDGPHERPRDAWLTRRSS